VARIRALKPDFFSSERIAMLTDAAKLTFQGLWCEADDYGVAEVNPRVLKGHIWPLADHVTAADISRHLDEMDAPGARPLIERYVVDGKHYALILGFAEHQRVPKPSRRRNPRPPGTQHAELRPVDNSGSGSPTEPLPESSGSPLSTTEPVETPLPEECAEEREREREREREVDSSSSSSGPLNRAILRPVDNHEEEEHENRARAVAIELGRRDSDRSGQTRRRVSPIRHRKACADTRWAVQSLEIIELVRLHPLASILELADIIEARTAAMALHPATHGPRSASGPSLAPPVPCESCRAVTHPTAACPFADDPVTDAELEQIARELDGR